MDKWKAFILIKPDGIKLGLQKEIVSRLQEKNINVTRQMNIVINKNDILNMWPYTQSDIIARQMFMDYLEGENNLVIYVESNNDSLFKDILEIKNYYRNKYGKHQFRSVLHSPASRYEYNKDISVLEKRINGYVKNETIIGKFKCYSELSNCDIKKLCKKIRRYLEADYKSFIERFLKEKNLLIVHKNDINDSCFFAGLLRDHLYYNFEFAYFIALSLNYYKMFPVMILDNNPIRAEIGNVLERYNYKYSEMKGYEFLYAAK